MVWYGPLRLAIKGVTGGSVSRFLARLSQAAARLSIAAQGRISSPATGLIGVTFRPWPVLLILTEVAGTNSSPKFAPPHYYPLKLKDSIPYEYGIVPAHYEPK